MDRGAPCDPARRPSAWAPQRPLPLHARRDVRRRAGSHRVRRPLRHAQGPARDLRDLLELRRGRAPLGARACGHARGAAQARSAVRPHRPRAPVRAAPVRDRRALGSRPDAGSDLQAAERLRARRPRRALAGVRRGHGLLRRRRAERDGRARGERGDRRGRLEEAAEERRVRPRRSWSWGRATSASSTSWRSGAA